MTQPDDSGSPRSIRLSAEQLKRIPLLSVLEPKVFEELMRLSRYQHYPRRSSVVMKGVVSDWLGLLIKGRIQVIDTLPNGMEVGLNILEEGAFFGEVAVIDRAARSATLIAMAPCDVIQVPGEVARQLLFRYPPVAEFIQRHFTAVVRRMNELRALLSLQNAPQRIQALLCYIMREAPGSLVHIETLPTHQELAIMVNTSRETVTRALNELANLGVVEKDGRRLIIRQPEVLRQLAEGGNHSPLG